MVLRDPSRYVEVSVFQFQVTVEQTLRRLALLVKTRGAARLGSFSGWQPFPIPWLDSTEVIFSKCFQDPAGRSVERRVRLPL